MRFRTSNLQQVSFPWPIKQKTACAEAAIAGSNVKRGGEPGSGAEVVRNPARFQAFVAEVVRQEGFEPPTY